MEKLEEILQSIQDNVYSHSLLSESTKLPVFPPNLIERLTALRHAQAPYYVVSGHPLARLVKRAHNLVLKLFGRKQAYHNQLTLDLLEDMTTYLQSLQEYHKVQASRIESLTAEITRQMEELDRYREILSSVEQSTHTPSRGQEVQTRGASQ
jgi:hypothetical protein